MTDYGIMNVRHIQDIWGDDYTIAQHYHILRKVAVQTDMFEEVPNQWERIGFEADYSGWSATSEIISKIAQTLIRSEFREDDTLTIGRKKVYSRPSYLKKVDLQDIIPPPYETSKGCWLEREIRKIIAGGKQNALLR